MYTEVVALKLKNRYIVRYITARGLPLLLCFLIVYTVPLLCLAQGSETDGAFATLIVCALCPLVGLLGYVSFYICRFTRMITRQESLYGVTFEDTNAVSVSRVSPWLLLSDRWLIQPGKTALYRGYIKNASIQTTHPKGGVRYTLTVKTWDGHRYTFHFRNEEQARKARNWTKK